MRRPYRLSPAPALALALSLLATAAGAQNAATPGEDATEGEAEHGAEAERPEPELEATAVLFFQALRERLPDSASAFCHTPFVLDGETIKWRKTLQQAFAHRLARTDLAGLPFNGVRLLTPEEMAARHGEPPPRLGDLDLAGAWIAVANLGGQGHVAVFRKVRGRWLAVAYTD